MPQKINAHRVVVSGRVVAHLFSQGQNVWLDWQHGYWDDSRRPVLGLAFEDHPGRRVSSTNAVPRWFGHLLPEGVLRRWVAEDARVTSSGELPLLVRLGHDLPGAVRVVATEEDIDPTWRPDDEVQLLRPRDTTTSGLRFSLAGVALKFSMVQHADRLTVPAHDEDGDWIVKMPDAVHHAVPQNEYAVMSMARTVGITVPEFRLVHRDEVPGPGDAAWSNGQEWAYAVRRFDRPEPGVRIHMEDFAQVRDVPTGEAKYRGSYETVAKIIASVDGVSAYLEFVRRLFFSWAVGNSDAHLKNFTLIYPDGRQPRLSPAYDLVSTIDYGFDDLALSIDKTRSFDRVSPATFASFARRVGMDAELTMTAVQSVAERLMVAWEEVEENFAPLPAHRRRLSSRLPEIAHRFS